MSETITVFDIEVLNNDPTSICSIGIVQLKDKRIVDTYYSLIRPHNLTFDKYRYGVHHIRPRTLTKEKTFKEVWEEIAHFFEDTIVVSHDVQGDMAHMRACFMQDHIPYPHLYMSCTNVLAHVFDPEFEKYNIAELADFYKVPLNDAHNALSDAKACAFILVKMLNNHDYETLRGFHEKNHIALGEMREGFYRNIVSPDLAVESMHPIIHPLTNASIAFTGKLKGDREKIEKATRALNAFVARDVNSHTSLLVVGEEDYKQVRYGKQNKKVLKALGLMRSGQDLKIVREKDYVDMIHRN